jgi:hypothetical protein
MMHSFKPFISYRYKVENILYGGHIGLLLYNFQNYILCWCQISRRSRSTNSKQGRDRHLAFIDSLMRIRKTVKRLLGWAQAHTHTHAQYSPFSNNGSFFRKRPLIGNSYFPSCFTIYSSYLLLFLTSATVSVSREVEVQNCCMTSV